MILTDKTTLAELQAAGATTLSDIPLDELLVYLRKTCLDVAKDMLANPVDDAALGWSKHFADAAVNVQGAIDAVGAALGPNS